MQSNLVEGIQSIRVAHYITRALLLSTPHLDNRQLQCWNITFYCMLEWSKMHRKPNF